jgi:autotransporter-associated beta strand protein
MSKKLNQSLAIGIFQIGILLSSISEGFSQTTNYYTWNNSTSLWSTSTAWNPTWSTQPSSGTLNTNVAVFAATGAGNNSVLLGSDRTVYGLIFTNGANAYTFASQSAAKQLDIMSGMGLQNVSGQNQIFNLSVANSGTGLWTNSSGSTTTFNNGLNLTTASSTANRTLTLGGAGTWNVASTIANGGTATAGAVTVTATGTTTLSGNNTYDGLTTMNAAGGTLTLSGNNSGAAGGVTLTAGTLNINNNNALGSGTLLNLAGTGATINNTSGSAVVNEGNQAWAWTDGLAFGASGNTAANNLNLGTGVVTASSSRTIALAGTGTKLTVGAVNITSTSSSRNITANGVGNTLEMGGLTLSASTTATTVTLAGTANIGVTGAIVNGTTPGNGVTVTATGTTTLSGNNTYTGRTTMNAAAGTLTLSGNNSTASGGVTLTAGTLNINNNNALGEGVLSLAGTGATINNTSGSAVVNAGNQAWTWTDGLAFGASGNTAVNNLNLGTGVVTVDGTRTINMAGSGTKLTIGAVNITSTSSGRNFTANGVGNTLEIGGMTLSANTTAAVTVLLAGSANINVTGAIVNGQSFANGVNVAATGITTFSGANTYTGATEIKSGATLLYGADNVTADNGGRILVDGGTLNLQSYSDTVSAMRVVAGGKVQGTGTLTANSVDSSGGYSFALYGENEISANLAGSTATLFKSTPGSVSLISGNNSYGGATSVTSGTLRMGSSTALGSTAGSTTVSSGGSLDLNGQTGVGERTIFSGTGVLLNSAVGTTASVGGTMDLGSEMVVNTIGDITLNGQLTGGSTRVVTKTGSGLLKVTASNSTFSGTSTVSAGTLLVDTGASVASSKSIVNGGLLNVNGTAGDVTVNNGGSLGGSGTVGAVTLTSGSYLKPGNSPGLLTASSASWAAGSYYNWEIDSNASSAVAGTNWDLFSVTGTLDMSALSSTTTMNLVLNSLPGFDLTSSDNRNWVIAQAGSLMGTGGAALSAGDNVSDYFNINATAFNAGTPSLVTGWKIEVGTTGSGSSTLQTLNLMAIPEPSTGSLLAFCLGGLVVTRLLRRKQS